MSGPFADAPQMWALAFYGTGRGVPAHTRPQWARIAHAIRAADEHLAVSRNPARVRGDALWCQVALDIHTELRQAGAHNELASTGTRRCFADRPAIRAWLGGPAVPVDTPPMSVLEAEGLHEVFPTDATTDPAALPALVDRAQDLGVFGIPEHRMRLWTYVGDGAAPAYSYVLTIDPTDRDGPPGLASPPALLGYLVNLARPPAETAERVLTDVAQIANSLIVADVKARATALAPADDQARDVDLPPGVHGHPIAGRARPFPPLSTPDPSRPTMVAPATPPAVRANRRHT